MWVTITKTPPHAIRFSADFKPLSLLQNCSAEVGHNPPPLNTVQGVGVCVGEKVCVSACVWENQTAVPTRPGHSFVFIMIKVSLSF